MALYGRLEYWNERYKVQAETSEIYDWYQTYNGLSHLLTIDSLRTTDDQTLAFPSVKSYFPPRDQCRVLILGCGNSTMAEDMVRDGWMGEIVNVDFSPVVIGAMKAKYGLVAEDTAETTKDTDVKDSNNAKKKKKKKAGTQTKRSPSPNQGSKLKFLCADITERLPFENESFDLILCKGALDAVLCSAGSSAKAQCLVRESVRLLAKGYGVFFLVTYGNPDSRVQLLEHENDISYYWKEVTTHTMTRVRPNGGAKQNDYVYVCRKGASGIPSRSPDHEADSENVDSTNGLRPGLKKPPTTAT